MRERRAIVVMLLSVQDFLYAYCHHSRGLCPVLMYPKRFESIEKLGIIDGLR
jgi:hypothetical protein